MAVKKQEAQDYDEDEDETEVTKVISSVGNFGKGAAIKVDIPLILEDTEVASMSMKDVESNQEELTIKDSNVIE